MLKHCNVKKPIYGRTVQLVNQYFAPFSVAVRTYTVGSFKGHSMS